MQNAGKEFQSELRIYCAIRAKAYRLQEESLLLETIIMGLRNICEGTELICRISVSAQNYHCWSRKNIP